MDAVSQWAGPARPPGLETARRKNCRRSKGNRPPHFRQPGRTFKNPEWDASHLICQFIDPIANLRKFGSRLFHVHAKDAYIHRQLLEVYGICHPGVAEHRFPGLGQANWAEIIHALVRAGYDSDLNIEGQHDPVFRNHDSNERTPLAGHKLEDSGLMIAKRNLEQYVPATIRQ